MRIFKLTRTFIICAALSIIFSHPAGGQTGLVKTDGITSSLHRANVGKITFMSKPVPIENYTAADFLKVYELRPAGDLNIRVFMADSLTNFLHRLGPELSAEELLKRGNYQFSFFVDRALVYTENLHVGAGLPEGKNTRTILRVPLMSTTNEDSWGRFMWNRFLLNGGEEALTAGKHRLKIEIRPYLKTTELKVGALIASGELRLSIVKPKITEKQLAIQTIAPDGGWPVSGDAYDKQKIRELNRRIAENLYKEITGIVVIKDGKLLIEEYFNGATRETLNDPRSVGKSFASAILGIAIDDGYLKSENQTLGDFYDLTKFANHSAQKDGVTLKSLLTMSSGFNGNDNDEASPGNEENMYPTADWIKFALDLPVDGTAAETGRNWQYFTAGVVVLGDVINRSVPGGLEKYADQKLFRPLGITRYEWPLTPQKVPSTAGGLRMRALDLAKFGQLYKNGGRWNDQQIIPREWIARTLTKHLPLPGRENEFYGYLFWNKTYQANNQAYETFYATGNGGNKIFVFQDRSLVVVITATAYNRPYAHPQADKIIEKYILPAVALDKN
jgi:CubicO group peptidase (beta-lactamase class C family)